MEAIQETGPEEGQTVPETEAARYVAVAVAVDAVIVTVMGEVGYDDVVLVVVPAEQLAVAVEERGNVRRGRY